MANRSTRIKRGVLIENDDGNTNPSKIALFPSDNNNGSQTNINGAETGSGVINIYLPNENNAHLASESYVANAVATVDPSVLDFSATDLTVNSVTATIASFNGNNSGGNTFNTNNGHTFTFRQLSTPTATQDVSIDIPANVNTAYIPWQKYAHFTPVLDLTSGSVTYTNNFGESYCTIMGSAYDGGVSGLSNGLCTLSIRMELASITSPVNTAMTISGIPELRMGSYPVYSIAPVMVHNGTVTGQVFARISHYSAEDQHKLELFSVNNGVTAPLSAAAFLQGTTIINLSIQFIVADIAY